MLRAYRSTQIAFITRCLSFAFVSVSVTLGPVYGLTHNLRGHTLFIISRLGTNVCTEPTEAATIYFPPAYLYSIVVSILGQVVSPLSTPPRDGLGFQNSAARLSKSAIMRIRQLVVSLAVGAVSVLSRRRRVC